MSKAKRSKKTAPSLAKTPAKSGGTSRNEVVLHSEAPSVWLWDLYPLADSSWGNMRGVNHRSAEGSVIPIQRCVLRLLPGTGAHHVYVLEGAIPPLLYVKDCVRRCYVPRAEDLRRVRDLWPGIPDAGNPAWVDVETDLVAAGLSRHRLAEMNAPGLLRMMERAATGSTATQIGKDPELATEQVRNGQEAGGKGRPTKAKTETKDGLGFSFPPGAAYYDGKPLKLPSGLCLEVLKALGRIR